jgi:hypothetical protein
MNHPYSEFERTRLWQVVEAAVSELEYNHDLTLTTARPYVIGYLCQHLAAQRVVLEAALAAE